MSIEEKVQKRIDYLIGEERKAIGELDGLVPGSIFRRIKWDFINELCHRRRELEDLLTSAKEATCPRCQLGITIGELQKFGGFCQECQEANKFITGHDIEPEKLIVRHFGEPPATIEAAVYYAMDEKQRQIPHQEVLTKEDYYRLIGTDERNAAAATIWNTIEKLGYQVLKVDPTPPHREEGIYYGRGPKRNPPVLIFDFGKDENPDDIKDIFLPPVNND